jgi:hypothetical protein
MRIGRSDKAGLVHEHRQLASRLLEDRVQPVTPREAVHSGLGNITPANEVSTRAGQWVHPALCGGGHDRRATGLV